LSGRVLEIGAGTGANLPHYPPEVEQVVAVEPEPYLRAQLERAVTDATPPLSVVDATGEDLPFDAATFDFAVSCLVLCSVDDPALVLAEIRRVLRPDAQLRFLEHVCSERPWRRRVQRSADATLWPLFSGGCRLGRDTGALIQAAGFEVTDCTRFEFHIPPLDPPKTHLLGVAHARATPAP
jgi:ubiquinone/menaquinone biosynthesis C-methylase UbiE